MIRVAKSSGHVLKISNELPCEKTISADSEKVSDIDIPLLGWWNRDGWDVDSVIGPLLPASFRFS